MKKRRLNLASIPIYIITTNCDTPKAARRRVAMNENLLNLGSTSFRFVQSVYTPTDPLFGCSYGHYLAIEQALSRQPFAPFLILEDDSLPVKRGKVNITIPKESDAVYLGISSAGAALSGCEYKHVWQGNFYSATDTRNIVRLYNMLSLHAVLVTSERYARNYQRCCVEACVRGEPVDVFTALTHRHYDVYGFRDPFFYQAESLGGQEKATVGPLEGIEVAHTNELPGVALSACQPASVALDMALRSPRLASQL